MKSCNHCDALAVAPRRFDVPHHLRRMNPQIADASGQRQISEYECVRCGSRWRWRDDRGWAEPPAANVRARRGDAPAPADAGKQKTKTRTMQRLALRYVRQAARRVVSWYQRQNLELSSSPRSRALAGYRVRRLGSLRGWRRCQRRVKSLPRTPHR